MRSSRPAAHLIRCRCLLVLCAFPLLTAGCLSGPTPVPTLVPGSQADIEQLVHAVQQTNDQFRRFFASGWVYRRDVTPVQVWQILSGGAAVIAVPADVADAQRAAIHLGCRADGSVGVGNDSVIEITSPTRAEATFRVVLGCCELNEGSFRAKKVRGTWRTPSVDEWTTMFFDCF